MGGALLRPAAGEPPPPTDDELARVAEIVERSPHSSAYLALLGDKYFLFDRDRTGFVMYGIEGRSWVALGDPVGPPEVVKPLVWRFRELSDRHGGWTVFYEVSPEYLPLYLDLGLDLRKLGEEARVDLRAFSLEGGARKALRQTHHRAAREGLRFEVIPAAGVDAVLPELERVSDAWLAQKETREKGFSLGFFAPEYLRRLPVAVVRDEAGTIVAFANLMPAAEHEELSCDLMRYRPGLRVGIMEFLFVELMLWGKAEGYRWFNLGMAPLSGFEDRVAGAAVEPARRAALPPRRGLLQLPGAAPVQGEVRSGVGAALPGVARRRRAAARAGQRRGAGVGRPRRDRRAMSGRGAAALVILLLRGRSPPRAKRSTTSPSATSPSSVRRETARRRAAADGRRRLRPPRRRPSRARWRRAGALVLGVDLREYRAQLAKASDERELPSADLEVLSQFAQRALRLPTYELPVLVGVGAGAALAYAALAQANPSSFRGAVSVSFCPLLALPRTPGRGRGLDVTPHRTTTSSGSRRRRWCRVAG